MIIRGTCCSIKCIHYKENNECYWSQHVLIYKGQCLKYEEHEEKDETN
jgi:hypothetical protein